MTPETSVSHSAALIANPLFVDVADLCRRLEFTIARPTQLDYFREVARRAAAFSEQARWLATDVRDIVFALRSLAQLEAALDPYSLEPPHNNACPVFPDEPTPQGIVALTRGWGRIRSAATSFIDTFGVTFNKERLLCEFQTATAALPPSFLAQLADGVALIESALASTVLDASKTIDPTTAQQTAVHDVKQAAAATVNARMIDMLQRRPESRTWGVRQWAKELGVSKSTIQEKPCWTEIQKAKDAAKQTLAEKSIRPWE